MPLPDRKDLISWITRENAGRPSPVTRREIARAFDVKGPDRADLRALLKELSAEGAIALEGKRARRPGQWPPVTVMTIERMDEEGDLVCSLSQDTNESVIILASKDAARAKPALGVGDRFLGRLHQEDSRVRASVIKPLGKPQGRLLGVFRATRSGGIVEPVSRKARTTFEIGKSELLGAKDGDLVWAEPKPQRGYGPAKGRITQIIGSVESTDNLSLIAIAEHDIPLEFPAAVLREAEALSMKADKAHTDLTRLPLMTIDPATARDHDDAVHAERLDDGGFRLTIAIADVSYFVRPGSALDKEAEKRGNSVYLPDRVVPMLPEELSNDLCSLKEGKVRLALCCEVEIGAKGGKRAHRFFRAKIKNHKNLAYEEAQAIADGHKRGPKEVASLFEAYEALKAARERRRPLDLDMPERRIVMEDGAVAGVEQKERMDAHRLIEEFMVLANVCAAETLNEHRRTAIYRVHDAPDPERLEGLRAYLAPLGYTLPKADDIRAYNLNGVLAKARERDEINIIALSVLRAQSQAIYTTENIGHFGLSLKRYAHFTSPIRRFADLTIHRSLVRALGLGPGGERDEDEARLETIAEDISKRERVAVSAERDTEARLLSRFLEEQVGATFTGRVSGVTRVGLFVSLDETGADGFIPARTLGWEYFEHDETRNAMVGKNSGGVYSLGMAVRVRLLEATPMQGGLRFEMLTKPADAAEKKPKRPTKAKDSPRDKPKRKPDPLTRHQKAKATAKRAKKNRKNPSRTDEKAMSPASTNGPARPKAAKPDPASSKTAPKKLERRPRKKR
ncbi:MAG: ribonuclease R [Pseudomonadota bacterium]